MKELSKEQINELLETLKVRFEKNVNRHKDIKWNDVLIRISNNQSKLWSLYLMENTGGEPDVVKLDNKGYIFYDCSKETPVGRRNLCYDHEALEKRKQFKPEDSAVNMASEIGIDMLNEEEYRYLQSIEAFDTKTSSWINTPIEIRKLGGAIFGDRRYDTVFIYHNGADSYYQARGFRGSLKI